MPNPIAHLAILAWPIVAAVLFARMPIGKAVAWAFLAGYLLLPQRPAYDLPLLPTYDKIFATAVSAFVMCLIFAPRGPRGAAAAGGWLPASRAARALMFIFVFQPFLTVALNRDVLLAGPRVLPPAQWMDIGSLFYLQIIVLAPFLMARRYLADPEGHLTLLKALAAAGVAYSIPILFEARLSPQLNQWIYGFYQFQFAQQLREGGFRPVVFLNHGLWTAIFVTTALIAAAGVWRTTRTGGWAAATAWLALTLVVCKSLGALGLGLLFAPLARFAPPRILTLAIAAVAVFVLLFPMVRSANLVPTRAMTEAISAYAPARAGSLQYRFDNEDILLAKANQRPVAGWGGWGRARVYDETTGADVSTTDGRWVITFGFYGWLGYIAEFGLLTLPLLLAAIRRRALQAPASLVLCVALAANLVDMIPNATLTPITWLMAGAVLGMVERTAPAPAAPAAAAPTAAVARRRAVIGGELRG